MNSKEYREFLESYNGIYEEVGVKTNDPEKTLQKMIDRQGLGGKVVPSSSKLQKAHFDMLDVNDGHQFDNFDIILEYLVSEGYADTNEAALVIMANMSEEWKRSIIEG